MRNINVDICHYEDETAKRGIQVLRTLAEAQADLAAYADKLYQVVAGAHGAYVEDFAAGAYHLSKRSRRSIVHDLMVERAAALFAGDKSAQMFEDGLLRTMVLCGKYRLRFKYHDDTLHTRNVPTQQVMAFQDQVAIQIELPFLPLPLTNVNLGYQMNLTDTALSAVVMTCPDGEDVAWVWELQRPGSTDAVPAPPRAPAPTRIPRVRVRQQPRIPVVAGHDESRR